VLRPREAGRLLRGIGEGEVLPARCDGLRLFSRQPKMTEALPIVCSLGPGELRQRLAAIAEVGAASLIGRERYGSRHLLRFRSDPRTRQQLKEIVAAEASCCSFLDLALEERGGELVLSVTAPADGEAVAGALATAFVAPHV
jgi:hypothetical protein